MEGLKTPDFTPEAIVSLLSTLAADVYIIFGLGLSAEVKGAITSAITTIVLVAFLLHSAHIRGKRATAVAITKAASIEKPDALVAPD